MAIYLYKPLKINIMNKLRTEQSIWQGFYKFQIWEEDEEYFIFYWQSGKILIIKKDKIEYIEANH